MSVETELKLRITPESLAKLRRHALLRTYSVARPVTRRLYNIYFDTPKLALNTSRMALRLRRVGRQWLQTLKGGGSIMGGLHQRNELEVPVVGPVLDFNLSEMAEWDVHLPPSLRRKLQPVFVTDFFRSSRMLKYQGAEIELCMDQGVVSTEQRSMPLCELELELKSGEPRKVFELALAILEVVPFELEVINKAQYGYRLLTGYVDAPVKAVIPDIARTDTLRDVLQAQIWSCLLHLQYNLRGAMGSDDSEYLHQIRVALRRLRVVLRMTERFLADVQLASLNSEVAVLCVALGKIREWDVFVAQTVQPMCQRMAGHTGLQALLSACEQKRSGCYASLRNQTQALELQRLILKLSIWMYGTFWQQQAESMPQVRDFATRRLRKLAERFTRDGKQLKSLEVERLHTLRILAKKLRYSAEIFASLYEKKKTKAFLSALSLVQEVLGKINDVAVAHRLLDELGEDATLSENTLSAHREAVVLAKGWIAHDLTHEFTVLRNSVRRFNKQSAFWEK